MSNTLAQIIADKRNHIAIRKTQVSLAALEAHAREASPPRGFKAALDRAHAEGRYGLIAEVKKGSPSKGLIREDFDPPAHARAYQAGGASCLSVLTDEPWFMGADEYLVAARAEVDLPVLRKDFMIDPWQVTEARALGADCILLIVACLDLLQMRELEAAALELGMDVLVEVHNPAEMEEALQLKSSLLGINNRNLKTLEVDLSVARDYAAMVPDTHRLVGESGLRTKADLDALAEVGVTSFLVGESLMREADVEAATRRLLTGQ
ncbi:indole-3-glycerol phosphate synthase [Tardibacter chloracetimidivorans]|uniref:Indole-3-glycerol phosphate synthase n=1 Tax=Tardibacter chloracetimidivorans TaxID=1921510 RepID=A0A1L3ZRB1_9SPHN|nr:indole-3-glycerol phosphate synthase TrpC [Tardibacter chloracetimidivorans]API58162.1 indole-3-glycerol phosphate synthase [Tardibacter chloracetimidivorans]